MNLESNARKNEKKFRSVSYVLVFLMLACIVLTISIMIHNILPNWHAGIMAGILLFIVIDRLYTYRHLKSLTPWSSEWAIAVGVQWVVVLVFSRFLLSYGNGPAALVSDLSLIARGYIVVLLTPEYVVLLFLAATLWTLSAQFLDLLDEVGLDMKWALSERPPLVQGEMIPAHQRMVSLIFTTGIVLVILTAMTRLNLQNILANSTGIPSVEWSRFSGAEAGALLYFVFGLALLSLSRLMSLQTHWNRLRIPVASANLPRKWAIYSLVFLLLLAMVVSILPAGDSLGFFSVLATLFGFLLSVFVFVAQLIFALLLFLFSLPFFLFGQPPPFAANPTPPAVPPLPMEPMLPTSTAALWDLIRSILLWGALIAIIVYAFARFVSQHEDLLTGLRRSRIVNWLMLAWQWLYRGVNQARGNLRSAITAGWQGLITRLGGAHADSRPGWISLRSLDPRRRVYFFYLAMIRRGGEQGLAREPSQTPSEYAARLVKAIPDAGEDVDSITEAFIEARYSRREVDFKQSHLVKAMWERIRRAMLQKRRSEKFSRKDRP